MVKSDWARAQHSIQAFLVFRGFDFHNFLFTAVYNSILFSSPLVLLSNLNLRGFCFRGFFLSPHINSVNRGMPVLETRLFQCGNNFGIVKSYTGIPRFTLLMWGHIKKPGSKNCVN